MEKQVKALSFADTNSGAKSPEVTPEGSRDTVTVAKLKLLIVAEDREALTTNATESDSKVSLTKKPRKMIMFSRTQSWPNSRQPSLDQDLTKFVDEWDMN